jgi:hypothetical protein
MKRRRKAGGSDTAVARFNKAACIQIDVPFWELLFIFLPSDFSAHLFRPFN